MATKDHFFSNPLKRIRHLVTIGKPDKNSDVTKSTWSKLRIWITIVFGLALFIFFISLISLNDLLNVFSNLNLNYFIAAFILGIAATVIKTIRYATFYPAPGRWLKLYGIFTLLRFVYYLLPFNSGELVYLSTLKRYKLSPSITETIPTWIYMRMTDVIALTVCFMFTVIFCQLRGDLFSQMYQLRWIFLGISSGFIVVIFSVPLWISKITFKKYNNWFTQKFNLLQLGFTRTLGLTVFFRTIMISIAIWTALIGWHVLAQSAFNVPLETWQKVLVSIAIYFLSLIPINTPLNVGTDEAAWTGALMLSGLEAKVAISLAISMRVISMLILITDGIIGFSLLILRENNRTSLSPLREN